MGYQNQLNRCTITTDCAVYYQGRYNAYMKSFFSEFKAFAVKGNVIELAVAVVIGAAFGKITTSLVDNIISPLMGIVLGGINFTNLSVQVGSATVTYGAFMQSVVDFVIIAFAIFIAVKVVNELKRKEEAKPETEKTTKPTEEIVLLREIRDQLRQR